MTILDVDTREDILLLEFNQKFDVEFQKTERPIEYLWSRNVSKIISIAICQKISETSNRAIDLNSRHNFHGMVDHEYMFRQLYYFDGLKIDFEVVVGSIVWKDGEIRITSKTLAMFLFLFYGGVEFLANYEDVRKGVQLLLTDVEVAYQRAMQHLPLYPKELFPDQPKSPDPDRVARHVISVMRDEELLNVLNDTSWMMKE